MTEVLDGNVAAGVLLDLFVPEMTTALTTCGACGDTRALAELQAYMAPGLVLRCRTCDAVQLRLVRGGARAWLDVRGIRAIQFEVRADPQT